MHAVSEIVVTDVTKSYGPVVALDGVSVPRRRGRDRRPGRAQRLREVDAASHARRASSATDRGPDLGRRRRRRARPARAVRAHAAGRPPDAVARRPRQRLAPARERRRRPARGTRAGGGALRRARPRRVRAGPLVGALGRDAPAGRLRAHAARREARAAARRALRRTRRDHPHRDAGVARRRHGRPAADSRPRDPRPRRGAAPVRPRRRPDRAARPGRLRARRRRTAASSPASGPWGRCDEPPADRLGVSPLLAILAAWQAWVRLRDVPDYLLPAPTDILDALRDDRSRLADRRRAHRRRDARRLRRGGRVRARVRRRPALLGDAPPSGLPAPRRLAERARRRRSRRCSSSTWASGSRPRW